MLAVRLSSARTNRQLEQDSDTYSYSSGTVLIVLVRTTRGRGYHCGRKYNHLFIVVGLSTGHYISGHSSPKVKAVHMEYTYTLQQQFPLFLSSLKCAPPSQATRMQPHDYEYLTRTPNLYVLIRTLSQC